MIHPRLVTVLTVAAMTSMATAYVVPNRPMAFASLASRSHVSSSLGRQMTADSLSAAGDAAIPEPALTTFREAEVLGLRLMQEGNYQEALNGRYCTRMEAIPVVVVGWGSLSFLSILINTTLFSHE